MPQVTVTKIVEGESHVVLKVWMQNTEGTGELVNYPIFSPADCSPTRAGNKPTFRIMQMWYGCVWYDVTLGFSALVPNQVWTIARDCDSHNDFRSFGGITDPGVYDNPPGQNYGTLLLSTNGFNVLGSQGSLILELRKNN